MKQKTNSFVSAHCFENVSPRTYSLLIQLYKYLLTDMATIQSRLRGLYIIDVLLQDIVISFTDDNTSVIKENR